MTLVAYLDTSRPLSEPKWVKTGDIQDWLRSMFGRMFWVAGEAAGWEKKVTVVSPDPVSSARGFISILALKTATCLAANDMVGFGGLGDEFTRRCSE